MFNINKLDIFIKFESFRYIKNFCQRKVNPSLCKYYIDKIKNSKYK